MGPNKNIIDHGSKCLLLQINVKDETEFKTALAFLNLISPISGKVSLQRFPRLPILLIGEWITIQLRDDRWGLTSAKVGSSVYQRSSDTERAAASTTTTVVEKVDKDWAGASNKPGFALEHKIS